MDKSNKIKIIVAVAVVLVIIAAILIAFGVQTAEYYQYGLLRQKSTGYVREEVYHGERVLYGPDFEMISYPATGQSVKLPKTQALTKENILIYLSISFQYFLRKVEVYNLHKTYKFSYDDIIQKAALDSIKDTAPAYTLREHLRHRPTISQVIYNNLRRKIEGDCCLTDCNKNLRGCLVGCKSPTQNCTRGFYVEVKYFQLGAIDFHPTVKERMLTALILTEDERRKELEQNATVVRQNTNIQVNLLEYRANEVKRRADAEAKFIRLSSDAQYVRQVENARGVGLSNLYSNLNITNEDHKKSFDYLRTLQHSDHVHISVGYDQLLSGTWKRP